MKRICETKKERNIDGEIELMLFQSDVYLTMDYNHLCFDL